MSEWNTIYDTQENIIGLFRHGVAWKKGTEERLGEYDDKFIYSNKKETLAKIDGDNVIDTDGNKIGNVSGKNLLISGKVVGSFIGNKSAGAAAIVLLFNQL